MFYFYPLTDKDTQHTEFENTDSDTTNKHNTPQFIQVLGENEGQSSVVSLDDGNRACNVVDNMVANTSHYHPVAEKKQDLSQNV